MLSLSGPDRPIHHLCPPMPRSLLRQLTASSFALGGNDNRGMVILIWHEARCIHYYFRFLCRPLSPPHFASPAGHSRDRRVLFPIVFLYIALLSCYLYSLLLSAGFTSVRPMCEHPSSFRCSIGAGIGGVGAVIVSRGYRAFCCHFDLL